MNFGENLRRIREQANMTQKELAERLCVNQSMVARWERGTRQLNAPILKELATIFGCTVDDLLRQETAGLT